MAAGSGLRDSVKEVARHGAAVLRLQAELARAELRDTAKNAGAGLALVIGAAFFAFFVFALLTGLFVALLALALPVWASVLIVMVVYIVVIIVLVMVARGRFRQAKGTPLAREQARLTKSALGLDRAKEDASSAAAGSATSSATEAGPSGISG